MKTTIAFEYVNRKGTRYFLCETKTKTGKTRYVFSREPTGTPLAAVPSGYEIAESVNGMVSLRMLGSCQIRDEEIAVVKAAVANHPHLRRCRIEARKKELVIYEAQMEDLEEAGRYLGGSADAIEGMLNRARLAPALRFRLYDDEERRFGAERMCYRGGIDGWLRLDVGPLLILVNRYVQHIGKESLFELI
ncbi:MAG TPA: hypothetical protein VMK12_20330 [Anaeromyxobacteraceae bacterium]|nr:hypothetical protein [Anaeromyxobacteraceae bacterium]